MHNAFLTMHGEKASKSVGNVVYLSDIIEKGFHPLSLRYFFLQAHYRTPLSFSWEALTAAANALERLWRLSEDIAAESKRTSTPSEVRNRFLALMRDDLSSPQALSTIWESLKSEEYTPEEKWGLLETAEAHFGLLLTNPPTPKALTEKDLPEEIRSMLAARIKARTSRNFEEADRIRADIETAGYCIEDGPEGAILTKTPL